MPETTPSKLLVGALLGGPSSAGAVGTWFMQSPLWAALGVSLSFVLLLGAALAAVFTDYRVLTLRPYFEARGRQKAAITDMDTEKMLGSSEVKAKPIEMSGPGKKHKKKRK